MSFIVVLAGAGCIETTSPSWKDKQTDPIDFRVTRSDVRVAHWIKPADQVVEVTRLAENIRRCDRVVDDKALARIADALDEIAAHEYHFTFIGDGAHGDDTWEVVVIPNTFGIDNGAEFLTYFDECSVGAKMDAYMMDDDWLVLAEDCEKATGPETTGCEVAYRSVRKSLEPK